MKQETIDRNIASITESLQRIFANHQKYFWRDQDKELPEVRYCQLQGILLLDLLLLYGSFYMI